MSKYKWHNTLSYKITVPTVQDMLMFWLPTVWYSEIPASTIKSLGLEQKRIYELFDKVFILE